MDVVSLGETMVLFTPATQGLMRHAKNYSAKIAGAETNTLIGLSRLGYTTGWVSRVGMDEFGAMLTYSIRGEGVDVSQVAVDSSAPTGIFFKETVNEQNVRIHYYRKDSAASCMGSRNIQEEYIAKAKFLYITGITPALSDTCCEATFQAIKYAKKYGIKVVFDPNVRRKLWSENKAKNTLLKIAREADIIFPGISEGGFLFGTEDPQKIGQHFLDLGASLVVVKLGKEGAFYLTGRESGFVSGFKIDRVVDPVGAGDGFAAGVLSGLLDGLVIEEAVTRGCAIGAMVTMVNGDIEGLPDRRLLEQFIYSTEDVNR